MKRSHSGEPSDAETRAHAYAREHGVSRGLYAVVRVLAIGVLRGWFRVSFIGREHIPTEGPLIVAPNHKNFLDAFFVGLATRRKVRFMAKIELFKGPLGWLFLHLGAFPVRRGEADAAALATARRILADGGLVVIFPEGTRVEQPDRSAPHITAPADWPSKPELRSFPPRSPAPPTCGEAHFPGSSGSRWPSSRLSDHPLLASRSPKWWTNGCGPRCRRSTDGCAPSRD